MNAKKAKQLRRMTREELGSEAHQERELVAKSQTVRRDAQGRVVAVMVTAVNDPFSTRGMYRGLKKGLARAIKGR